MQKAKKSSLLAFTLIASLSAIGGLSAAWGRGDYVRSRGDNAPSVRSQSQTTLADQEVKQLVLLLDQDNNGKISKEEFMKFMSSEFDRLDKDKSGELDVKELRESQIRVAHPDTFSSVGK